MASPFTTWSTSAVGSAAQEVLIREDVGDLISNLYPLDTPLQQLLGKRPMNNVFCENPIDTFPTALITRTASVFPANSGASGLLAKPEGYTYTDSTPTFPYRLKAVAEIQGQQFSVSDTDRAMSQYGMADRFAYQALRHTQSVVNNFEHAFWWSPGTPPSGADLDSGGGAYIARQTQGLCHWIFKTGLQRSIVGTGAASYTDGHGNDYGTNYPAALAAMAYAYNAGGVSLDHQMFKNNLMLPWYNLTGRQAGATGFASPKIKNMLSEFALRANGAVNQRNIDAMSKMLVDSVDYYETDYGIVSVNMSRYLNIPSSSVTITLSDSSTVSVLYDEVLLFIKPEYYEIGVVRPVHVSALGKTGDFEQGLVRGEQGLICRNPSAGAGICNAVP